MCAVLLSASRNVRVTATGRAMLTVHANSACGACGQRTVRRCGGSPVCHSARSASSSSSARRANARASAGSRLSSDHDPDARLDPVGEHRGRARAEHRVAEQSLDVASVHLPAPQLPPHRQPLLAGHQPSDHPTTPFPAAAAPTSAPGQLAPRCRLLAPDPEHLARFHPPVGDAPVDRLDLELAPVALDHDRVEPPAHPVAQHDVPALHRPEGHCASSLTQTPCSWPRRASSLTSAKSTSQSARPSAALNSA